MSKVTKKSKLKTALQINNERVKKQTSIVNLHDSLLSKASYNAKRGKNLFREAETALNKLMRIKNKEQELKELKAIVPIGTYDTLLAEYNKFDSKKSYALLEEALREKQVKDLERLQLLGIKDDDSINIIKEYYRNKRSPIIKIATIEQFLFNRGLIKQLKFTFKDDVLPQLGQNLEIHADDKGKLFIENTTPVIEASKEIEKQKAAIPQLPANWKDLSLSELVKVMEKNYTPLGFKPTKNTKTAIIKELPQFVESYLAM